MFEGEPTKLNKMKTISVTMSFLALVIGIYGLSKESSIILQYSILAAVLSVAYGIQGIDMKKDEKAANKDEEKEVEG